VTAGEDAALGGRHLVGEVQRFGLLSAAAVVERYIEAVDRAVTTARLTPARLRPDEQDAGWLADSAARMAEACLRLLDSAATLMSDTAAPGTERVVLASARSGSRSETSLWIHNPTSSATAVADLHVTNLVSSQGLSVPVSAVSFSPPRVGPVEPGTSREVRLRIEVPAHHPAGQYYGLVLSSAAPDAPIMLRLDVEAQGVP
jgi:hypothetical protein